MGKIIKGHGDELYLDVTDKARDIAHLFKLWSMWERDGRTYRLPIMEESDLEYALNNGRRVCIEVASGDEVRELYRRKKEGWPKAKKILIDGYIYVKYSDLYF